MIEKKLYISASGEGIKARVTSIATNERNEIKYISFFARERQIVSQIGASLMSERQSVWLSEVGRNERPIAARTSEFLVANYSSVDMGNDSYVHALCYEKGRRGESRTFLQKRNDIKALDKKLYSKLMELFDLPLLSEWIPQIKKHLFDLEFLRVIPIEAYVQQEAYLDDYFIISIEKALSQEQMDVVIKELFESGKIKVSEEDIPYEPITSTKIDDFYVEHGKEIVEGIIEDLDPLIADPKPKVDSLILKMKRLFPQQGYIVNALREVFKKSDVALMVEDMGCGKTLQAMSVAESYLVDKYMRDNNEEDVQIAIKETGYRNFVLCPSHLVRKWAKAIKDDIPGANVVIIKDFKTCLDMVKLKGTKPVGKTYYIMSKDKGKLSYQYYPALFRPFIKLRDTLKCTKCGALHVAASGYCHKCRAEAEPVDAKYPIEVYRCPTCDTEIKDKDGNLVSDAFFRVRNTANSACRKCKTSFWAPYVLNLGVTEFEIPWVKRKVKSNPRSKSAVTKWFRRGSVDGEAVKVMNSRKYAPADFIKKKLGKNFFDVFICDELHLFKGGNTAQGRAMHLLHQCSKKTIGLTGTLSGGYASHLFYTLWRLMPNTMKAEGFDYSDEIEFARRYGTVETTFYHDGEVNLNSSSKGASRATVPKVKPGISGLIYTDFLFEISVFLNMTDLSAFLPEYKEEVVAVELSESQRESYNKIKDKFKSFMDRDKKEGWKLQSTMLQTLLSYPDKPYGLDNVYTPSGELLIDMSGVVEPDIDDLTPKEKRLIELIISEQEEGRNSFVFAEYTGDGDKFIADRLLRIIEYHCGLKDQVLFMKSGSPSAEKREEYIHKMASRGIKVFICNPRLVETGLDFIFEYGGKEYNFPTLFFYQLGTNLFTLWQASKRAYRLSQTKDCRTYYFAYQDTLQWVMLTLMGKKKMATAALQGKFSSEGLCTNSGVDVTYQLLSSLKQNISGDSLETIDNIFKQSQNINVELTDDEREFIDSYKTENFEDSGRHDEAAELEAAIMASITSSLEDIEPKEAKPSNSQDVAAGDNDKREAGLNVQSMFDFIIHKNDETNKSKKNNQYVDGQLKLF